MADRAADRVTVPDVVGLPFHIGRDVAAEAGVALANPDPDGPPIAALTWPGLFYITLHRAVQLPVYTGGLKAYCAPRDRSHRR